MRVHDIAYYKQEMATNGKTKVLISSQCKRLLSAHFESVYNGSVEDIYVIRLFVLELNS